MTPPRPIARPVRILAILTVLATVVLLTLGALTTSFRAGMADPVWPTEPWFLLVNGEKYNLEEHRGFLLEHTHRAAGFTVGILASLLAIAAWIAGPKFKSRIFGIASIVALLTVYGGFHRQMHVASDARAARQLAIQQGRPDVPAPEIFPVESGIATATCAALVLLASIAHLSSSQPGKWVRSLAGIVLVCVMIQGLLGGYRVYLDQLLGPELSQIHGTFAQAVFAAMCCIPALAAAPDPPREPSESERRRLAALSLALPALVFLQLVWGVMVRHTGGALAQRMHLLTAFAVLGVGVWFAGLIRANPETRRKFGFTVWHLLLMFAVQVALGVEAYLGKFAAIGPQGDVTPMARKITESAAAIRTLHVLIGTAILASSVVLALRVWRKHSVADAASDAQPAPADQYAVETISLH
jgi:cytochrome c oxidase assembly protein subunit 15